jgi:Protein of unknown function, DUF481
MMWFRGLAMAALIASLADLAMARDKTDVIVLKNGDRITGEVKKLENGILDVDLDYVDGTLAIDWLKVDRFESKALFLVKLQDGTIFSASVVKREALNGTPLEIELQPEAQESIVIDRSKVVAMTQTSASLWHRFSGSVSLGSTYAKANSTAQYNFGSELDYLATRWGSRLSYGSNLSSSTGAPTATRNQVDFIAQRLFPWKNYFYAGTAGFLQSTVQGIQRQTNIGFGVGRYLKNTNRVRFSVLAGLGWQRAAYVDTTGTNPVQNTGVALLSTNLQIFSFKKTRLNVDASMAPALTPEIGRIFSKLNTTYYLKLFGKIDWNLSLYGNWDTRPPAQLPSSDYGTSTGLSYTFGNK